MKKAKGHREDGPESQAEVDGFRAQHLDLSMRQRMIDDGVIARVLVNDSESPLAWLARRKGRDGQAMISPHQFLAGEKLRGDFTRAQMSPRVTSSWATPTGGGSNAGPGEMTDLIVASRQRVRLALQACGPEFAGLLMDVCCFLRGLEDVERVLDGIGALALHVVHLCLGHAGLGGGHGGRTGGEGKAEERGQEHHDLLTRDEGLPDSRGRGDPI